MWESGAVVVCVLLCSLLTFVKPSNRHLNNLVRSKLLSIASFLSLCPGGMLANWMTLSFTVPYEHVPNAIISAKAAGYIFLSSMCVRVSVHMRAPAHF